MWSVNCLGTVEQPRKIKIGLKTDIKPKGLAFSMQPMKQ